MKIAIVFFVLLLNGFVLAKPAEKKPRTTASLQAPIQQSANGVKAVLSSVLADPGFSLMTISKIHIAEGRAKVQLLDQQGTCVTIPYMIKLDKMGLPSATPDRAALAQCD